MYKVITFIFLYPIEEAEDVSSTKKQKSKLKKKKRLKPPRNSVAGTYKLKV